VSMTWVDNAWLAPAGRAASRLVNTGLMLVVRAAVQLGWRTLAACCGVLSAGWMASAVPQWINPPQTSMSAGISQASALPVAFTGTIGASMSAVQAPAAIMGQDEGKRLRRPEWVTIQRPLASFALGLPDVGGQQIRHVLRRDLHSHVREEQIRAGEFTTDAAYATITVRNAAPDTRAGFFIEMTRFAAEGGLAITRASNSVAMASKFGLVETADVIIDVGQASRACIGFRHTAETVAFSFQGWFCGNAARAADRQQLTCMIDRLNLVGSGEDKALRSYFGKAELNRQQGCLSPKLAAAGRKTSWLDADQAAPQLRRSGG
jgi:hypothetical protein